MVNNQARVSGPGVYEALFLRKGGGVMSAESRGGREAGRAQTAHGPVAEDIPSPSDKSGN